jgi:histidinol-phosphate phosphatase family protein
MIPALFLDRDGTINYDCPYCHNVKDLKLYKDIPEIVRSYNKKEYLVIVISNQSGIDRGYFTDDECVAFNNEINKKLKEKGCWIDAFYYCPHRPDENCNCRKPKTGLVDRAVKEHGIDLKRSVFVGNDRERDGGLAKRLGIKFVFLSDEREIRQ